MHWAWAGFGGTQPGGGGRVLALQAGNHRAVRGRYTGRVQFSSERVAQMAECRSRHSPGWPLGLGLGTLLPLRANGAGSEAGHRAGSHRPVGCVQRCTDPKRGGTTDEDTTFSRTATGESPMRTA